MNDFLGENQGAVRWTPGRLFKDQRARRVWAVVLAVTGGLLLLVHLPPFVGPSLRSLVMTSFSTVCHQLPDRSPHLGGVALAVCHRCYGIYWGLFLAVPGFLVLARWARVLRRHAPLAIALSLVPLGIDWLGGVLGIWHNTPHSRLLTGWLFGMVAGSLVVLGALEAIRNWNPASRADRGREQAHRAP